MNKILFVYASKTGTTEDAATEVAKLTAIPCDIYNCSNELLKKDNKSQEKIRPEKLIWDSYEMIVIGTAMYMRSPMKEIKLFCKNYRDKLKQKKLILFTCGIESEEADKEYLWKQLPQEVSQAALYYCHLGGEIREDRMNALSRLAMREYVKKNGPVIGLNQKKIIELSSEIIRLMK